MCPNHPEHIVDQRLLPPEFGITDRMVLWDKHAPKDISESSVKLGFLRKLHRKDPPYRLKRKVDLRKGRKVKVPSSIKAHYRYPPNALPQSRLKACLGGDVDVDGSGADSLRRKTIAAMKEKQSKVVEDKERWLREMIAKATNVDDGEEKENVEKTTTTEATRMDDDGIASVASAEKEEERIPTEGENPEVGSESNAIPITIGISAPTSVTPVPTPAAASPAVLEKLGAAENSTDYKDLPSLVPLTDMTSESKGEAEEGNAAESIPSEDFSEKSNTASSPSRGSAAANAPNDNIKAETSVQGVPVLPALPLVVESVSEKPTTTTTTTLTVTSSEPISTLAQKHSGQPSAVVVTTELDLTLRLNALDRHLVEYLALDRLRQLMIPEELEGQKEEEEEPWSTTKTRSRRPSADRLPPTYPTDRDPIALLSVCEFDDRPTNDVDEDDAVIPMFSNTFTIGTNADCDVDFSDFVDPRSPCYSRFSPRHVVIFYDKYTGLFELLNYGVEGAVVDGVYYGCDVDANRNRRDKKGGGAGTTTTTTTMGKEVVDVVEVAKEKGGRGRKRKDTQTKKQQNPLSTLIAAATAANKKGKKESALVKEEEDEEERAMDRRCECGRTLPRGGQTKSGWEGSAVLYHGSVIQIGCFTLVFSVFET